MFARSASPAWSILLQLSESASGSCRMTEIHVFARRFQRRAFIIGATLLVVALAGGVMFLRAHRANAVAQVPFSDLLSHLDGDTVAGVVVTGDTLDFTLTGGQTFRTNVPANYVTANTAFVADLARRHVRIRSEERRVGKECW